MLSERERDIIQERRLKDEPATLEESVAEIWRLPGTGAQIEVRAFEKLQSAMRPRQIAAPA